MEKHKYKVGGLKYTEEEFRQIFFNDSPRKSNDILEISDTEDDEANSVSSRHRLRKCRVKTSPKVIMKINLESDDENADDDDHISSLIKSYENNQNRQRNEKPANDAEAIRPAKGAVVTDVESDLKTKIEDKTNRLESGKQTDSDLYKMFSYNFSQPRDFFNDLNSTPVDARRGKFFSRLNADDQSTSKVQLKKRGHTSKSSTAVVEISIESEDEKAESGALSMLEKYEKKKIEECKNEEAFATSDQSKNIVAKNKSIKKLAPSDVIEDDTANESTHLSKSFETKLFETQKPSNRYRIWKSKQDSFEKRLKIDSVPLPATEMSCKLHIKPDNKRIQTSFKKMERDRTSLPSTSSSSGSSSTSNEQILKTHNKLNDQYKNKLTYIHKKHNQKVDISQDRKMQGKITVKCHKLRLKSKDKSDEYSKDDTFRKTSSDMEREDIGNVSNSDNQLHASITCRVIRFGTYRYEPKEKVIFTPKGIKIFAPSCKNPLDAVVLNIQIREIVKIVAHFSKSLNILFIYTLPICGCYVRESLEMKPKSPDTPYYNPMDRAEPYKRIVLQMESMIEEHKTVIRSIFTKEKLEEVQCSEANELLVRSCMKEKYVKQDQCPSTKTETENIRQILIYPPGKGGMPINTEDYMCLAIDQYLNDVIIDFFLKYLHLNILTEEQRPKTHIFSSFFYNRLTTMTTRQRQSDKDLKLTASQKRHARVKSWTKNVNLFEKDFIIIPINEQSHWFLAIVCFPRLQGPVTYDTHEPVVNQPAVKKKKPADRKGSLQIGSTTITPLTKRELDAVCLGDDSLSERDEAEGDESDLASDESDSETPNGNSSAISNSETNQYRPIKQPLILIFDSLAGASRSRVVATLRDYLTCEYRAKIKEDSAHVFNKLNMPGHCVKVPQQNNFTDCGLYVLQYVEQFFKDPIQDYKLPIKQLVNWFETIVVTRKREEISNLLKELVEKYNPDRLPLPEIAFPTLNGNLVEPESTDEQAEFEEEEMEDEGEEEEEDEADSLAAGDNDSEASPLKRNGEKRIISIATSGAQAMAITLKRPHETELTKSQETIVRKTARLNESN